MSDSGNEDVATDEVAIFETGKIKAVEAWDGKLRRLRKRFIYPNVGLKEALAVWYYGGYYQESCLSEEELINGDWVRFPPLRLIPCHDLERHNHVCRSKWSKLSRRYSIYT